MVFCVNSQLLLFLSQFDGVLCYGNSQLLFFFCLSLMVLYVATIQEIEEMTTAKSVSSYKDR